MELFEAKKIDVALISIAASTRRYFECPLSCAFLTHIVPTEVTESTVGGLFELLTAVQTLIRWLLIFDGLVKLEDLVLHTELISLPVGPELRRHDLLDIVPKYVCLVAFDLVCEHA